MELQQLRYFVAVARTGNFSRAAEQCFVSQPSLSQQIQKLEVQLGQQLLDRLGRRAVLTDAGRLLLERAVAILSAVDDAEHRLKDFNQLQGGRLTVGAIPTIAPYLLPAALEKFLGQHPSVEVVVHEYLTHHLLQATAAGELDLALAALPINDERLTVEPLFTEPLLLALPPGHPLAKKRRLSMEDVRTERFILLNEMHCLGEQSLRFCQEQSCPRIACWNSQLAMVQRLIAMGQGVSLLPAMAQSAEDGKCLIYRKLANESPARTVAALWHRQRYHSIAAERFLACLHDLCKSKQATRSIQ